MTPTILLLSLALLTQGQAPARTEPPRKPHPLAPSLPQLTDEEEKRIEDIVHRFILFDTGRLPGAEGQKAAAELEKLGPEAIFVLIRALSRALEIEATCPAVTIGKKIQTILRQTQDPALLDFARENLGLGVKHTVHGGIVRELRTLAFLRRRDIGDGKVASPSTSDNDGKIVIRPRDPNDKSLAARSTLDLAQQAREAKGEKLKGLLNELEKRTGETAITALATAGGPDVDSEIRYYAHELLLKNLGRQSADTIKKKLTDPRPEVRTAAAYAAAEKKHQLGAELIDLLKDTNLDVAQSARQALTRLAGGDTDHGPERSATDEERAAAIRKWREWWAKQAG
ncbi:MAG: hypothetical protein JNM56_06085 [Planctomycetia bacterium]|nr:hypothetical protein [Planctomycetia bacterium]